MAGVIGVQPIPLADFPVLLGLQMFMVSLIIYVSGRDFSLRVAGEFAASLGIGFSAGLVFRETARGPRHLRRGGRGRNLRARPCRHHLLHRGPQHAPRARAVAPEEGCAPIGGLNVPRVQPGQLDLFGSAGTG
jgi:hypothetical protein